MNGEERYRDRAFNLPPTSSAPISSRRRPCASTTTAEVICDLRRCTIAAKEDAERHALEARDTPHPRPYPGGRTRCAWAAHTASTRVTGKFWTRTARTIGANHNAFVVAQIDDAALRGSRALHAAEPYGEQGDFPGRATSPTASWIRRRRADLMNRPPEPAAPSGPTTWPSGRWPSKPTPAWWLTGTATATSRARR